QAEDGIRDFHVTGVQTCALPISPQVGPTRPASMSSRFGGLSPPTWYGGVRPTPGSSVGVGSESVSGSPVVGVVKSCPSGMSENRSEERRVGEECGSRGWRERESK